jgi:hypothetical protein
MLLLVLPNVATIMAVATLGTVGLFLEAFTVKLEAARPFAVTAYFFLLLDDLLLLLVHLRDYYYIS